MQLSVLLPTVRPEESQECLKSLHLACQKFDSYEIVVVSDFHPNWPLQNTKWVLNKERKGPIKAICEAESHATGEYLFLLSDEDRTPEDSLFQIYQEALESDQEEILVPWCGSIWHYYGKPFPPFPFIKRELATKLGGLLDPAFGAHYADPDLGMRAHKAGVKIRFLPQIRIEHPNNMQCPVHQHNVDTYFQKDETLFKKKWDGVFAGATFK